MKKNLPTIIIVALIVLIIGFVAYAISRPEESIEIKDKNSIVRPTVEADPAKLSQGNFQGPIDAKVTLSEFGDYECPACEKYQPVIKEQILPKYQDKLKFVFLNYPLPRHKNAQTAAQAAEAAALQGKFWEMHDILYQRQSQWVEQKDPSSKYEEYAKEIGINIDKYRDDYNGQIVFDIINQQAGLGDAFKIPGTPTFFVNGIIVDTSKGSDAIIDAIDKAFAQ